MGWRIGIDVGGTNTDAVVLGTDDQLLAKAKRPTTPDVSTGIIDALDSVLGGLDDAKNNVTHVALGTTQATNAILERRDLRRVAAIRVGGPATHSIPPLVDWPSDLRSAVCCASTIIDGGSEMTGEPLVELDEDGVSRFLEQVAENAEGIAISSVFSPVNADHELRVADLAKKILGEVPISLSHEIGALGLLERENACVLNAALVGVAHRLTDGLTAAMLGHGLDADAYIAQNDGTLMGLEYVRQYPVLTIGSGPTNSMRGAAYLTGFRDALVIDVGGTSTDIGILNAGFPRESATAVDIGGVRTNFRMPDLVSIAIGGGTVVHVSGGSFVVGPESIGYRLTKESVAFGGETLTLTDAAVGTGRSRGIGDPSRVKPFADLLGAVIAHSDAVLADAVDRAKSSRSDLPGIAVGGGSILIPENVAGVGEIHRPDHYDVANAIGAAISSVSGEVDRVYKLGVNGRESALREAIEAAKDEAVRAGAAPDRVEVVEIQELPLAYLTDPVARIRVKAAGPLAGR